MRTGRRTWRWLVPLLCTGALAGCSLLKPLPKATTVEQRLSAMPTQGLPLQQPVSIYWDQHQVPFIQAATDDDAAFVLGLVHAHLRLGQMAIYRRIVQGRVAEMGGPLATDIDHGVRILDFGRATAATLATMPEATKRWLQRFVDGVNHYQATAKRLPFEYEAPGARARAVDGRRRARLRPFGRRRCHLDRLVRPSQAARPPRLAAYLGTPLAPRGRSPSFHRGQRERSAIIETLLAGLSRSGSNSLALAPKRTRNGAAILANDPHLGINVPNTWILAGVKSPSYHAVGLMIPGLPLFAIGRNPWIAWGGTNMRATASDLSTSRRCPRRREQPRRNHSCAGGGPKGDLCAVPASVPSSPMHRSCRT